MDPRSERPPDQVHTMVLVWIICVLLFIDGLTALTQHPEWFGAGPSWGAGDSVADRGPGSGL